MKDLQKLSLAFIGVVIVFVLYSVFNREDQRIDNSLVRDKDSEIHTLIFRDYSAEVKYRCAQECEIETVAMPALGELISVYLQGKNPTKGCDLAISILSDESVQKGFNACQNAIRQLREQDPDAEIGDGCQGFNYALEPLRDQIASGTKNPFTTSIHDSEYILEGVLAEIGGVTAFKAHPANLYGTGNSYVLPLAEDGIWLKIDESLYTPYGSSAPEVCAEKDIESILTSYAH